MKKLFMVLALAVCAYGQTGLGKSTLTCLDKDGDGYGVGAGCLGPDADDNDSSVHSGAQAISKYGTLAAFLSHRGYTPSHIWYLAPATASPNCVASIGSCVGNDSTGVEDDINHPFATWAAIVSRVQPNHMVMMRDNYNSRINAVSGTSGNPVIYLSFPGEAAYFNPATYNGATILIGDVSWIIIDGVKATQAACLSGGSTASYPSATTFHDDIFQNLECTSGGGGQGLGGFSAFNGLVNITIQDSVFHDNNGPNQQHGIYIGSRTIPGSNVVVRRNIIYNTNSYPGIQFNGRVTNLVMEQNLVYNVPDASAFSWMEGVSNSFLRDNVSFNVGAEGLAIVNYDGDCYVAGSSGICPYDQTGNVIENNTFYVGELGPDGVATAQPALEIVNLTSGCPTPAGSCTLKKVGNLGGNFIRNNIFVSNAGGTANYPPVLFPMCTLASEVAGTCILDTSETTLSTTTFANNIFWNTGGHSGPGVVGTGPNPGFGYTAHTCADLAGGLAISSGCMNVDPMFVSANPSAYYNTPASFNFGLLSGSPAIGAGATAGAPAVDVSGNPRANPPSIGAYEPAGQTSTSGPAISALSCGPLSLLSGGAATCTVTLGQPAGVGGALVAISSNSLLLTVPTTAAVAAGASTVTFTITAGTISTSLTAVVTATLNGSSQTASVTLTAPTLTQVSSVTCTPGGLASAAISTCTVTLTQPAGAGGATVTLASGTLALTVPASILVAAGSSAASFSATTGTIATAQSAVITATLNGASSTASISLTTSGGSTQGSWQQAANTTLMSVCPANNFGGIVYPFASYCANVIDVWSGAAADTKRNRLIIWGGGHSDYSGNEIYALNVGTTPPTMTRLTNPSAWNYSVSYEVNPDGTPTSRHTYNDLVYLPVQDALFSFSGGLPSGTGTNHTWIFTFADNTWHAKDPVNGFNPTTIANSVTGAACAYDPNTQTVFCIDGNTNYLLQYNPVTNTYARLTIGAAYALAATPAIDPVRKLMVFMGNAADGVTLKVNAIDISGNDPNYTVQDWTSQVIGCAGMSADWPGFVYDSAISQFVGYPNQGSTVYTFNAGTKTCAAQTFSNGPQTNPVLYGTFGRFQYFPSLNTFALVNDPNQNAYSVSLSSAPTAPPTPSACDLNGDGVVNALDVQIAINQALGISACSTAALMGSGQCNVVDVQRVINASLGGVCLVGP